MAGSEAEERIRGKVEAAMRRQYPDARIIHELVLDQFKIRIDLAAVTTDQLIVAEIKSERDTLKRLKDQVGVALQATQQVWLVLADKHWPNLREAASPMVQVGEVKKHGTTFSVRQPNPAYVPDLYRCRAYRETESGIELEGRWFSHSGPQLNPRAMLNMLHAGELQAISQSRWPRQRAIDLCVETMPGKDIRRAVCAAVRSRSFPRADTPFPWTRP